MIPTSGTDTILDTSGDDVNNLGPLATPAGFTLFGVATGSVFASTNGFLSPTNLGVGDQFNDVAFPLNDGIARIAAFWDDLVTPPGQLRSNSTQPGTLVVIWNGVAAFGQPSTSTNTFEAVLLGAGNSFGAAPGTIILSYDVMSTTRDGNATIGLNSGNGTTSATIPALTGTGGVVTGPPVGTNNFPQNAVFTFTPNGTGYNVTLGAPVTGVPEPSSLALIGLGGLGLTLWRRLRAH